jgi:hypothetical protein
MRGGAKKEFQGLCGSARDYEKKAPAFTGAWK